ncbi:MAG: EF-hand domain-containing protein [Paracoccaceae bacterium]
MKRVFITAAALTFGAGLTAAQAPVPGQHFLDNWDLDGDGKVTLDEATERRGDVFFSFDADENGELAGEEYDLFDEARANDQAQHGGPYGLARGPGPGNGQGQGQGQGQSMGTKQGQGMGPGPGYGFGPGGRFPSPLEFADQGMRRRFNDPNGDGVVTRAEFVGQTAAWLEMMDRDGDGVVTLKDFAPVPVE